MQDLTEIVLQSVKQASRISKEEKDWRSVKSYSEAQDYLNCIHNYYSGRFDGISELYLLKDIRNYVLEYFASEKKLEENCLCMEQERNYAKSAFKNSLLFGALSCLLGVTIPESIKFFGIAFFISGAGFVVNAAHNYFISREILKEIKNCRQKIEMRKKISSSLTFPKLADILNDNKAYIQNYL